MTVNKSVLCYSTFLRPSTKCHMRGLRLSSIIMAYEGTPSSGSNASSLNAPNKLSWSGKPQLVLQSHQEYLRAQSWAHSSSFVILTTCHPVSLPPHAYSRMTASSTGVLTHQLMLLFCNKIWIVYKNGSSVFHLDPSNMAQRHVAFYEHHVALHEGHVALHEGHVALHEYHVALHVRHVALLIFRH